MIADYMSLLAAEDVLGHGFSIKELVKPRWKDVRGRFKLPPPDLHAHMPETLRLANALRDQWVANGGKGLRIAAAYRPWGGAKRSQHKRNAALDLDLLKCDYDKTHEWYRLAVRYWCLYANDSIGLGLYCRPGRYDGIRVHIDTGFKCRTWQIFRGRSVHYAAAFKIAADIGLEPPTRTRQKVA